MSYLPRAWVMVETFLETNRDSDALLFVPDLSADAARACRWPELPGLRVFGADAVPHPAVGDMRRYFDAFEFCCAFKSFALEHALFALGYEKALLLDPDIACYAALEQAWQALERKSICLTPHSNTPQPADGSAPQDREMVSIGFVNGGFWGARASEPTRKCMRWVQDNVRHFGFFLPEAQLYADQSWMSAIPWLFHDDTDVIRDPGYNVAYWNLHERDLKSLVFFHFSGYDEREPGRLTRHSERRYDQGTTAALSPILRDYSERLAAAVRALSGVAPDRPFVGASPWRRLRAYKALHGARARLRLSRRQTWALLPRIFR